MFGPPFLGSFPLGSVFFDSACFAGASFWVDGPRWRSSAHFSAAIDLIALMGGLNDLQEVSLSTRSKYFALSSSERSLSRALTMSPAAPRACAFSNSENSPSFSCGRRMGWPSWKKWEVPAVRRRSSKLRACHFHFIRSDKLGLSG